MKKMNEFDGDNKTDWKYNYQDYPGVVIIDINMEFLSMVIFMIKWAIAAIPAFIILGSLGLALTAFFGGLLLL